MRWGKRIFDIQKHLLQRKHVLMPLFLDLLKQSHLEIGTMDPETLYDFAVLEFDFNYWQYISDYSALLSRNKRRWDNMAKSGFQKNTSLLSSSNDSMIAVFPMCVWWLLDKTLSEPFFYQCFTQMGTYGYEEELFPGLKFSNYSTEYLAGDHPKFSRKYVRSFNKFLKKRLKKTIFIYGAEDPWTACRPNISAKSGNLVIINPNTNHSTLIKDVADPEKKLVQQKILEWLKRDVVIN